MDIGHYQFGTKTTLENALEIYEFHTETQKSIGSKIKYLIIKDKNNYYSVVEKVSGLIYIIQLIGSFFGKSKPTYSYWKTNKTVLLKEIKNLIKNTNNLENFKCEVKSACCILLKKLNKKYSNLKINIPFHFEEEMPFILKDLKFIIQKSKEFILKNNRKLYMKSDVNLVKTAINTLKNYKTGEELNPIQLKAYVLLISITNKPTLADLSLMREKGIQFINERRSNDETTIKTIENLLIDLDDPRLFGDSRDFNFIAELPVPTAAKIESYAKLGLIINR